MVIKCNEEFQASGEIFWGSVVFSQPLNHASELTSHHQGLDEHSRNSFNVQLLKILLVGVKWHQYGVRSFLGALANVPCVLDSDSETEVPNLRNGRGRRGLANDPSIWSACLQRFVERMNVSSAYICRLGLRGVLPPGTGHGSLYWRCSGFCLCGHCELRATFNRTPEVFEPSAGSHSRDRWHCQQGVCSGSLPPLSVSLPFCPFLHAHCFGSHWVPSIVEAEICLCSSHWGASGLLCAVCMPLEGGTINFPGISCFPHLPCFFNWPALLLLSGDS